MDDQVRIPTAAAAVTTAAAPGNPSHPGAAKPTKLAALCPSFARAVIAAPHTGIAGDSSATKPPSASTLCAAFAYVVLASALARHSSNPRVARVARISAVSFGLMQCH